MARNSVGTCSSVHTSANSARPWPSVITKADGLWREPSASWRAPIDPLRAPRPPLPLASRPAARRRLNLSARAVSGKQVKGHDPFYVCK